MHLHVGYQELFICSGLTSGNVPVPAQYISVSPASPVSWRHSGGSVVQYPGVSAKEIGEI